VEGFNGLIKVLPDHLVPVVTLAYYTGMRRGEILGLTWDRVNMKEGYVDLGPQDTKTSQPRRIYFNEVMWSIFRKASKVRRIDHNFAFTRRGNPLNSVRKGFTNACQRAKIKDLKFHDLRHTYNTNFRKAGVDQQDAIMAIAMLDSYLA
jgi:integrase